MKETNMILELLILKFLYAAALGGAAGTFLHELRGWVAGSNPWKEVKQPCRHEHHVNWDAPKRKTKKKGKRQAVSPA